MQELTTNEIEQVNGGVLLAVASIVLVVVSRYAVGSLARHAAGMAGAALAGAALTEAAADRAKGERGVP